MGTKEESIWNPTFIGIVCANALMYLGQQMVQTLVGPYASTLGATSTVVGIVASGFAYTALLFKLVSAPAIDVLNKKYILVMAMAIMAISFLGYSMTNSIPVLFAFRLLQGVGQAFSATCCLAMATDALPQNQLGKGIGFFSLGQALCQAIGPTIGLKIANEYNYHITFGVATICMIVSIVVALTIKTPPFKRTKKFQVSLSNMYAKEAVMPAMIMLFLNLAFCNVNSFLVIYGETERGLPKEQLGYFFTVYALTLMLTRPILGILVDKYGYLKTLIPSMCMFALSFYVISLATTIPMLIFSAIMNAFGYGACQPAIQSLCMKRVPKEKRGAGSCTSYIGNDIGNLIGPVMAGAVAGKIGYAGMWKTMTIVIYIAMAILILNRKQIKTIK